MELKNDIESMDPASMQCYVSSGIYKHFDSCFLPFKFYIQKMAQEAHRKDWGREGRDAFVCPASSKLCENKPKIQITQKTFAPDFDWMKDTYYG